MIIVHLENLMRKKAYEDKRKINLNIVAKETGISFPTLHNIVNKKNNSTSTAILDNCVNILTAKFRFVRI